MERLDFDLRKIIFVKFTFKSPDSRLQTADSRIQSIF